MVHHLRRHIPDATQLQHHLRSNRLQHHPHPQHHHQPLGHSLPRQQNLPFLELHPRGLHTRLKRPSVIKYNSTRRCSLQCLQTESQLDNKRMVLSGEGNYLIQQRQGREGETRRNDQIQWVELLYQLHRNQLLAV